MAEFHNLITGEPGGLSWDMRTLDDGNIELRARQDEDAVKAVLERNKQYQADGGTGYLTDAKEMKHVASIPAFILQKWREEFGVDVLKKEHGDLLKRLLNDPDYLWLRVGTGRV